MFKRLLLPFIALRAFVRLVRKPQDSLEDVVALTTALETPEALAEVRKRLPDVAQVRDAYVRRPRMTPVDEGALLALPPDSLGHRWMRFLKDHGFSLADLPAINAGEGDAWFPTYMRETHDLLHVLLGFDTDLAGEMGVQGFVAAQLPGIGIPYVLFAGLLLNSAFYASPEEGAARVRCFVRGYQMGSQARLLLGTDWKALMDRPLDEVRAAFEIRPEAAELAFAA